MEKVKTFSDYLDAEAESCAFTVDELIYASSYAAQDYIPYTSADYEATDYSYYLPYYFANFR